MNSKASSANNFLISVLSRILKTAAKLDIYKMTAKEN